MSEMGERIAMAIKTKAWSIDLPLHDEECADLARVAIEAMRKPTQAMIDVGMQEFADPCWPENVSKGFGKMIDEALK